MKITKLEHSGLIFEKAGQQLVFDPVEFNQQLPEMSSVAAIVITHKHGDHFQPEKLAQILAQNPTAKIFATTDLDTDEIAGHPIEKVEAGVVWDLAGFHLEFFGRDHAPIVPGVVPCRNIGTVIDARLLTRAIHSICRKIYRAPKFYLSLALHHGAKFPKAWLTSNKLNRKLLFLSMTPCCLT